jgi:ribonuclease P protein component
MLKKANRLAKDTDIKTAFARGRTFFNPFFTIKALYKPGEKRFTVVISTKVFKNATDRNRLKRLVREYLRKNLSSFKSGNYIIVAKPKVKSLPEADMLKSFIDLCAKLR